LQPIFEPDFQRHSYESGPERNAHQAIAQSLENINSGFKDIVDIDLKRFFDEVEHHILLELIYKKVKCKPTMKLTRTFKFIRPYFRSSSTFYSYCRFKINLYRVFKLR